MNAISTSLSIKYWKWLFLVLEAVVLIIPASCLIAEHLLHSPVELESEALEITLVVIYMGAFLFLLIASPFFLRSLRWVALAGWVIALGTLILGVLTPAT